MLTSTKKHCLCHRCKETISVFKFTFRNKVYCWNCGNSKNRNDRTVSPYAIPKWGVVYKYSAPTYEQKKEFIHATRLEF